MSVPANAYYAVRADLVLRAQAQFGIRSSLLEAGEKRVLVTAQRIQRGATEDRWGHHAQGVLARFCEFTADGSQPALPWIELVAGHQDYDGEEGISARTGNRPLATVERVTLAPAKLTRALAETDGETADVARVAGLPVAFVSALGDGTWPSVSRHSAQCLTDALGCDLAALTEDEARAPETPRWHAGRYGVIAAAALLACVAVVYSVGRPAPTTLEVWEVVGYWDYDAVDGAFVPEGVVVKNLPGQAFGLSWQRHLEVRRHQDLPPRQRQLWPVEMSTTGKRVCINYPDYPSYNAFIDHDDDALDGVYAFGPCGDRVQLLNAPTP